MDGSYASLAREVKAAFISRLSNIRRRKISSFLRSKKNFAAVYLIFDQDGALVYVGRTKRVRGRLQAHLSTTQSSSLLNYVCRDAGVNSLWSKGHLCECKRFRECGRGEAEIPPDAEADEISERIAKTYTVAFLVGDAVRAHSVERLLADILRPKYGFHREG